MTDIGQEANKPRIVEERNQGTEKPLREKPLREKLGDIDRNGA